MFGWARSLAASRRKTKEQDSRPTEVARELRAAWRLAFVVVGDAGLATRALSKAYHGPGLAVPTLDTWLDLLAKTLRISLTRVASGPPAGQAVDSAVIAAMWQLPAEQRAALWLAEVESLDNVALAAVLGLTAANAGHVAGRAAEWLDVALDQDSGPLCPFEADIVDFVLGELPGDELHEFEAHLPDCATCSTKVRAYDELGDLPDVLDGAIPEPPAWLSEAALEAQGVQKLEKRLPGLAEPGSRTPAVRPLVVCCVALIAVALVGVRLIDSEKSKTDPPAATVVRGTPVGSSGSVPGATATTTTVPPTTATTVTVTTTSLPVLTFPTIPPGTLSRGSKK